MQHYKISLKDIGELIGEGKFRMVYQYLPDINFVVKINKPNVKIESHCEPLSHNANKDEHTYYKMLKNHKLDYWVAKCCYYKGLLLMEKASPVIPGEYLVPSFFGETRNKKNWGMINNRIVCLDYAWIMSGKKTKSWYIKNSQFKVKFNNNFFENYYMKKIKF